MTPPVAASSTEYQEDLMRFQLLDNLPRSTGRRLLLNLLIIVALSGLIAPAPTAASTAEVPLAQPQAVYTIVFPDVEGGFNGMKVGYTVTGATLGQPQDSGSSLRYYQGRLGTGALTVSGWVEQNNGYGADLSVSVTVGGREERYDDSGSTPWRQEFSVSVPIPAGETKGEFSIMVTGSYNAGDRTLFVGADFAPENMVPVTVSGQAYTPLQRVDSDRGFPAAVRSSSRAPLAGVAVDLVRVGQGAPGNQQFHKLASTTANQEGQYTFPNVPVTTSLAISVGLQSADLAVWDASASPTNYNGNPLPTPAAPVYAISQPFAVTGAADVTVDLAFSRDGSFTYPAAGNSLLARLDSFGLVYYHTWQALQLAAQLGVNLDTKPLPVYAYLDDMKGAYWRVPIPQGAIPGSPRTSPSAARPRTEASPTATSTTAAARTTANGTNSAIISWPMRSPT